MEHNRTARSECLSDSIVNKAPENRQYCSTEDLKLPEPACLLSLPLELRELKNKNTFRERDHHVFLPICCVNSRQWPASPRRDLLMLQMEPYALYEHVSPC